MNNLSPQKRKDALGNCRVFLCVISALLCASAVKLPSVLAQSSLDELRRCTPQPQYPDASIRSVYIPMRDGVRIAADVILPKDLSDRAKLPTILIQTRYWRSFDDGKITRFNRTFALHGYAVVNTDVRGSGASFGHATTAYNPAERSDMAEVLRWIVAQSWSNGRIGTTGNSYMGNTAELTMLAHNPALKLVVSRFSDFDLYAHLMFPGGLFNDHLPRLWGQTVDALDRNQKQGDPPRGVRLVDEDKDGSLLAQAIAEHAHNADAYTVVKSTTFRDDIQAGVGVTMDWYSTHTARREIEQAQTPIYTMVSWFDAGTAEGALARFMTFRNKQRLVIGPWNHGGSHHISPYLPVNTPPDANPQAIVLDWLRHFDQYLKGIECGLAGWQIAYYTMGEEKWKTTNVWPLPATKKQRWYFSAGNTLTSSVPTQPNGADEYTIDFAATTGKRNRWSSQVGGGDIVFDNRAEADKRLLTYTSAPLAADLEITGQPVVTLQIASTASDGYFIVYLEDVAPDGQVFYLTEGYLRALHRKVSKDTPPYKLLTPYHTFKRKDALPLVPGQMAELSFGLFPTSVLLRQGHRLRVAIAGADKDTFIRFPEHATPTITIARNQRHLSFIDLPIIPRTKESR